MKFDVEGSRKFVNIALKAYRINPAGNHFLLAPDGGGGVGVVHGESGIEILHYSLEEGETIEELRDCLEPLFEGGHVMAPTAHGSSETKPNLRLVK
jgi:hypothetical protein